MNQCKFVAIIPLTVILIVVGIWFSPRILAIHYQVQGGQVLSELMNTLGDTEEEPIACILAAPVDENARARLGEVISRFETALRYDPKLAQADLLLGRAYCLTGEYQNAIAAYRAFTGLRPGNPLGHLELAFAYQKSMADLSGSELSADELRALILAELSAAGVDPAQLVPEAGNAFLNQKYQAAASLFEMAENLERTISSSDALLWDMAEIVHQQSLPMRGGLTSLPVYALADSTRIEAEDMIWLAQGEWFGKPLSSISSRNPDAGVFWWSGASAFVVQVEQPGPFRLILSAQNTPPAPVNLQIEHNFAPILNVELTRQDLSWQEFETDLYLEAGLQLISVRFTNDATVDGVDRNAVVDWVELERK